MALLLAVVAGAGCGDHPAPAPRPDTTPSTTTTTAPVPELTEGIASVSAQAQWVHVGTWHDGGQCAANHMWRLPRRHPDAIVAVTADRTRVVELDAASGAELAATASWDASTRQLLGEGVEAVGSGRSPALSGDGEVLA